MGIEQKLGNMGVVTLYEKVRGQKFVEQVKA